MSPDWVDGFARSLIQHSARNAPASLSERLEEEWLADFEGRSGRMARLRFGVGCCWATRVIAHEYLEPKVVAAAAGSATGSKVMIAYAQDSFSFLSRRTTAVALIIGLHAVIIYGFATGLVHTAIRDIVQPMVTTVIPFQPKPKEPPPLLPPTLEQHPIQITKSEIPIDVVIDKVGVQDLTTDDVLDHSPVILTPTTPTTVVNRVLGGPGKAFPNTDDYYPPPEIRMGRTGISTVQVCTDEKGRLTAAPTLAQSSGSAGLDEGALKLAKAGSGHYRATTEDGRAVSSCYAFRVKFDFKK
jgi:TonB family protein